MPEGKHVRRSRQLSIRWEFRKVSKWQTNKVFMFLGATATACLATVAASPNAMVLAAAGLIWVGALLLARYLLAGAYRRHS